MPDRRGNHNRASLLAAPAVMIRLVLCIHSIRCGGPAADCGAGTGVTTMANDRTALCLLYLGVLLRKDAAYATAFSPWLERAERSRMDAIKRRLKSSFGPDMPPGDEPGSALHFGRSLLASAGLADLDPVRDQALIESRMALVAREMQTRTGVSMKWNAGEAVAVGRLLRLFERSEARLQCSASAVDIVKTMDDILPPRPDNFDKRMRRLGTVAVFPEYWLKPMENMHLERMYTAIFEVAYLREPLQARHGQLARQVADFEASWETAGGDAAMHQLMARHGGRLPEPTGRVRTPFGEIGPPTIPAANLGKRSAAGSSAAAGVNKRPRFGAGRRLDPSQEKLTRWLTVEERDVAPARVPDNGLQQIAGQAPQREPESDGADTPALRGLTSRPADRSRTSGRDI